MCRSRTVWIASLVLFCATSGARANTAVVVPPSTDTTAPPEVLELAANELMRLIRVQGFDVITPGQASAAAEDAQQSGSFPTHLNVLDCRSVECAVEYRRLFDASFSAQLFLSGSFGTVRTVTVTITESPKATFSSSAPLRAEDVKGAVQAAYGAARDKYVRGEGPWLTIQGGPSGALVFVDDQEYGALPIEHRYVAPGKHRLVVRAAGYVPKTLTLDVPARVDHEERVELSLLALDAGKELKLDRTWDYVLGGMMMAAGAAHLSLGVFQFLRRGDCAEREAGECGLYYGDIQGMSQEKLLMGLGAAGMALGATWMGVGPIARIRVRADARSAALSVQGAF